MQYSIAQKRIQNSVNFFSNLAITLVLRIEHQNIRNIVLLKNLNMQDVTTAILAKLVSDLMLEVPNNRPTPIPHDFILTLPPIINF